MFINTFTTRYNALGTTVEAGIRMDDEKSAQQVFDNIHKIVDDFEKRFSRFRTDSEISRLNDSAGTALIVSSEMIAILKSAREIWERTNGLIDPTIGQALISAGYDSSFELVQDNADKKTVKEDVKKVNFGDVVIDRQKNSVLIPEGVKLDVGGLGKGYLLDLLDSPISSNTNDFWISLGGDLIVSGLNELGKPWTVGVQNPADLQKDLFKLDPLPGKWGIATSGTTKRHGVKSGVPWHHIIDPRTGLPVVTDVLAATVIAPTALEADVAAKVVLMLGSKDGIDWAINQRNLTAVTIRDNGQINTTPAMEKLLSPV